MKSVLAFAILLAALLQLQAQDIEPTVPADAVKSLGKPSAYIELTVQATKNRLEKRGLIYLDSEASFEDANNLGIALSAGVAEQLKSVGIEKPEEYFLGKKIRVTGPVMRFEERLYLPVLDIAQLSFDRPSPTTSSSEFKSPDK